MLAGLQDTASTLFPAIRSLVPTDDEVTEGEHKERYGRLGEVSGYKTGIVDMHVAKERTAYTRRMMELTKKVQTASARILVHDRQMLHRKDGSTGWFSYLEWMEYTRKDKDA